MPLFLQQDRIIEKREAFISPDDRGYYFGDGIYEVFRIYHGALFEKEAHMERFIRSAREVRIPLPYAPERMKQLFEELAAAEGIDDGTLYVQITRGSSPRNHAFPPPDIQPVLTGSAKSVPRPADKLAHGVRLISAPDIRWLRCDIKSLNLLPNILAKQEAVERGADEAVFHRNGTVTECSSSNIMIVKNGTILTHPANHLILHGITRAVAIELAEQEGIPLREEPFNLEDLLTADEGFLTGTTVEIMPVIECDGVRIGNGIPGPVTRTLQQAFATRIGRASYE